MWGKKRKVKSTITNSLPCYPTLRVYRFKASLQPCKGQNVVVTASTFTTLFIDFPEIARLG